MAAEGRRRRSSMRSNELGGPRARRSTICSIDNGLSSPCSHVSRSAMRRRDDGTSRGQRHLRPWTIFSTALDPMTTAISRCSSAPCVALRRSAIPRAALSLSCTRYSANDPMSACRRRGTAPRTGPSWPQRRPRPLCGLRPPRGSWNVTRETGWKYAEPTADGVSSRIASGGVASGSGCPGRGAIARG